jgi:hypothetical protein
VENPKSGFTSKSDNPIIPLDIRGVTNFDVKLGNNAMRFRTLIGQDLM